MVWNKRIVIETVLVVLIVAFLTPSVAGLWNWKQVSKEGFGDLANDYAFGMSVYSPDGKTNYLYVGTLNTKNVVQPITPDMGTPNLGAQVWRTDGKMRDGKYIWQEVVGPHGSQAKAGFNGTGIRNFALGTRGMIVYKGLLWVGTMPVAEIFVTDGKAWKRANLPYFGTGKDNATSVRGMTIYKGKLYVAAEDEVNGVHIFRYDGSTNFSDIANPANQNKWKQVNYNGFDKTGYTSSAELIPFNPPNDGRDIEYLYAGGWSIGLTSVIGNSHSRGLEVWRTNGTKKVDGTLVWEQVVGRKNPYGYPPGWGNDSTVASLSSIVFKNNLYIGTADVNGTSKIWRTSDGIHWIPVVPDGFGRKYNAYMWRMIEYKNNLIVGTMNPYMGAEIWTSTTGNPGTFRQVNLDGMDLSYNLPANLGILYDTNFTVYIADQYGVRSTAIYQGYLVVGTASWADVVDQVLYQKTHGRWNNLSGYVGLEIWRTDGIPYIPINTVSAQSPVNTQSAQNPVISNWIDEHADINRRLASTILSIES